MSLSTGADASRLALLGEYGLLDTPPESAFDEIVAFAASLCEAPIALISLIEEDRQWFKACFGLGVSETPVEQSFCSLTMHRDDLMVIADARTDPRFADNPLVTGDPWIRFYAGAPLRSREGIPLGALCVIDREPRAGLTDQQAMGLRVLANQVMAQFELRREFRQQRQRDLHIEQALEASSTVGTWEWDIARGVVIADSRFAKLAGLDPELASAGVPFGTFQDRAYPEDREAIRNAIADALASDRELKIDYRMPTRDGAIRWISVRGAAIFNGRGEKISYSGVAVDVTDRKAAEIVLSESEAQFRALADSMPQMVWSTRPDGYHDYFNARWYEFTGLPPGATDGEGWNNVVHPDDQQAALRQWATSLASGEPYEIEYRLRHRSGEYRWALGRALPVIDDAWRISRWFGTCTDVNETRLAKERLFEAGLRLELALEAAKIGVWDYDIETDRINWDDRVRELIGLRPDLSSIDRAHFVDVIHPEDRAMVETALEDAANSGAEVAVEYRVLGPEGGLPRWVQIQARRIVTGGTTRILGTTLDIDALKRLADEQELVAQELSHRIKNIFSVMSGIISLSSRSFPESKNFAAQLRQRLMALSRAHDYVRPHSRLSRRAPVDTNLFAMLTEVFAPYRDGQSTQIQIDGVSPLIDDRAATPFALVFHELATNASKYGALSLPGGTVTVLGEQADGSYRLRWREIGGPPIEGVPLTEGFGSTLAKLSVESQLGGTISRHWLPEGLIVDIVVPMTSLRRA